MEVQKLQRTFANGFNAIKTHTVTFDVFQTQKSRVARGKIPLCNYP